MDKQLHNLCEDKEYMAKIDALPLEAWGGQELTPDQLEMWQRGQNAYNNAFKFSEPLSDEQLEDLYQTDREFKVIP